MVNGLNFSVHCSSRRRDIREVSDIGLRGTYPATGAMHFRGDDYNIIRPRSIVTGSSYYIRSITLCTQHNVLMLQIVSGGSGCSSIYFNKTVCCTAVCVCVEATRVIDVFRTADDAELITVIYLNNCNKNMNYCHTVF